MNLKSRKKGITVAMAATMILIIALMTTTITIAVVKTVKGSNLKAFATELSLVQNTIQEYSYAGSINEYLSQDVTLTVTSTEQFSGETIANNSVLLHVLNLEKMGIEKSVYGAGKNGDTDYYAVSLDTMKVYYIAGYDDGDKMHYSLTDELTKLLNGENTAIYTNNIIFKANTVEWTNSPVIVEVYVPTQITSSVVSVTVDNSQISVSDATASNGYNKYTVNAGEVEGNFIITVEYMLDGETKTETYTVSNFDNEAPTIFMGSILNNNNTYYLNDVHAIDNGGVKIIKYIEIDVAESNAKNFFKSGGNELVGEKVKLSNKDADFTIYAEDYAGNYTTSVVTIPDGFYYIGGTKDTGVVISDNEDDVVHGVDGDTDGNQFVWVPVDFTSSGVTDDNGLDTGFTEVFRRGTAEQTSENSGIYKMTGNLSQNFIEPYENGYDTEEAEYYAMCASVEKYGGFYIARFEAGDGDAKSLRRGGTEAHMVVSKKGAYVYNYVAWGDAMDSIGESGAVYLSQQMYSDSKSVVSTLCYGVQWDATLNFVSDAEHSIKNSVSWGNFKDSENDNSGPSKINFKTGRDAAWQAKNIYDLAGNVREWTMEYNSSDYRVNRGGSYNISGATYSALFRSAAGDDSFSNSSPVIGFRVALYII